MYKFKGYEVGKPIDWDYLCKEYDWLDEMKDVEQDKEWHSEGSVLNHTKMVVESLLNDLEFQLLEECNKHIVFAGAIMHDIEKRSTTKEENGRIVSPRHSLKGESTVRTMLYKQGVEYKTRETICKLVRHHSLPIWTIEKKYPDKEVIAASLKVPTNLLYLLAKADVNGRIGTSQEEMLDKIEMFKELCIENMCYDNKRIIGSLKRYSFLNKPENGIDYDPYDDKEFKVIMMCALPGAGKDKYINKYLKDVPMVSLDNIRRENGFKPTDKKENGKVIQIAKENVKELLRKKETFVFNATNTTRDMRGKWTSLFNDYNAKIEIMYIEVEYDKLLHQNKNREYSVPENVIDKLLNKLDMPSYDEAHEVFYIV